MTDCLEKCNCPGTHLEFLSFDVCTDLDEEIPGSIDVLEWMKPIQKDPSITMIGKDETPWCISFTQEIDAKGDLGRQFESGFDYAGRIVDKMGEKVKVDSISMAPIHRNKGFFVWDFAEHDRLLKAFRRFGKDRYGKESKEAHDYAEINLS